VRYGICVVSGKVNVPGFILESTMPTSVNVLNSADIPTIVYNFNK